jgi:hypothetical protein
MAFTGDPRSIAAVFVVATLVSLIAYIAIYRRSSYRGASAATG